MIKSVKVTVINSGENIVMPMVDPEQSGFIIRDIQGLDPSKADINMTNVMSSDGAAFNSARINRRNIVLTLEFLASLTRTIEEVRLLSYKYFPIKQPILLKIETDTRVAQTIGYTESNEINIFSKGEKAVISILCPSAYFNSEARSIMLFSGLVPLFEFPFENASLTEKLLEMGTIEHMAERSLIYDGDAPTGVEFYLHAVGPVVNPTITNTMTRESMTINTARIEEITGSGIIAGDDIVISTVKGNKFIRLLRGGEVINIFNCLDKNTNWFQIKKGDNPFAYTAESGIPNLQFRVEYQTLYEGL